jgi:hypothetical protein
VLLQENLGSFRSMREMAKSWLQEALVSERQHKGEETIDHETCEEYDYQSSRTEHLDEVLDGEPIHGSACAAANSDKSSRKGGPPSRPPPPVPNSPSASAPSSGTYCFEATLADGTHVPVGQLLDAALQDDMDIPIGAAVACGIVVEEENNETDEQLLERLLAETGTPDATSEAAASVDALFVDDNR